MLKLLADAVNSAQTVFDQFGSEDTECRAACCSTLHPRCVYITIVYMLSSCKQVIAYMTALGTEAPLVMPHGIVHFAFLFYCLHSSRAVVQ